MPEFVDHEDLNKLNNRINNLREADKSQNCSNSSSRKNSASIYKGVSPAHGNKWKVRINVNKKQYNLGTFSCQIKAALIYNKAAIKYHKEFAQLNIIQL